MADLTPYEMQLPPESGACRVGLVITTYNRPDYLRRTLRSLEKSDLSGTVIALVDDGSQDVRTIEILSRWQVPGVPVVKMQLLRHDGNRAADNLELAWDLLISHFDCELLAVLDPDTVVKRDWLARMVTLWDEQSEFHPYCIVTGFNADDPMHPVQAERDHCYVKNSVGGISLLFDRSTHAKIVRPALSAGIHWDVRMVEMASQLGCAVLCTRPSVVQHFGRTGYWASQGNYDFASDYWGTSRVMRAATRAYVRLSARLRNPPSGRRGHAIASKAKPDRLYRLTHWFHKRAVNWLLRYASFVHGHPGLPPKLKRPLRSGASTLLDIWASDQVRRCEGHFRGYNRGFAHLKDAILDPSYCAIQTEPDGAHAHILELQPGFWQLPCAGTIDYVMPHHLRWWAETLRQGEAAGVVETHSRPTLAIRRYEYANVFFVLCEVYNAFLMARFFGWDPDDMQVILVDNHPQVPQDAFWAACFERVMQPQHLTGRHLFADLVFSLPAYNGPMRAFYPSELPLIDQFRLFLLGRFGIRPTYVRDPARPLTVRIIERKDYDVDGKGVTRRLWRKISNPQIVEELRSEFPDAQIEFVAPESLSIAAQVALMHQTDVLIGMHGAGMANLLFLPVWAGVIELFPLSQMTSQNTVYFNLAMRLGLRYESWTNTQAAHDGAQDETFVPLDALARRLRTLLAEINHAS